MLNKKIIVTGGSYGMGASIVARLVSENCRVWAMSRSADSGQPSVAEQSAKGPGKVSYYRCDVSDRAMVKEAFAAAAADMGGLDGLVHVAGVEAAAPAEEASDKDWDHIFGINAHGTFITNQEIFPYLKDKGGRILNFGSGAGITGAARNPVYAASKGAVAAWTRSAALSWGKHNIAVNLILPGVWTPMYDATRARLTPAALAEHDADMARRILLGGKLGNADTDVAPVIAFLLSDDARFMTGQSIPLDGGALMMR